MNFDSLSFLRFIFVSLCVFYLFRKTPFRRIVLAIINISFLFSFAADSNQLFLLFFFILLGYAFIQFLSKNRNKTAITCCLTVIIILFLYLKKYPFMFFVPPLEFPYSVIGLSYIFFRIMHLMIDVYGKSISVRIGFLDYLNYMLLFTNLVSGPIQLYQDYKEQESKGGTFSLTEAEVYGAFSRIAYGFIKTVFLAPLFFYTDFHNFQHVFSKAEATLVSAGWWYACVIVSYALHMCFNFSGYMDIVIGIGRLFGFSLPENFNNPIVARNYIDMWSRWHITLSGWFRTYFFNPFLKAMGARWGNPKTLPYLGAVAYLVVWFVLGLWHGSTKIFIIYGIYQGLGVSINKFTQILMRDKLGKKKYTELAENYFYQQVCRGMTLSYFSISVLCVWSTFGQLNEVFGSLLVPVFIGIFIVQTVLIAAATALWDTSVSALLRFYKMKEKFWKSYMMQNFWLALRLWFIAYAVLKNINPAPEFIYMGF